MSSSSLRLACCESARLPQGGRPCTVVSSGWACLVLKGAVPPDVQDDDFAGADQVQAHARRLRAGQQHALLRAAQGCLLSSCSL